MVPHNTLLANILTDAPKSSNSQSARLSRYRLGVSATLNLFPRLL
jgi:hypothetical protein